ncbi:MAG: phosphoribosylanthranilate isomerase [Kordiimonadaceae bacterium]|nr:phosphoribosylanthranilate isomerase [Kordiimonadaceae bacterium]
MSTKAKICGLSTDEAVRAAVNAGATYIGFVFYPKSPRNVSVNTAARLAKMAGENVLKAGVFVNPTDELLNSVINEVDIDIIQLHGNESVERVKFIRSKFGKKVMKAISVAGADDIKKAHDYENAVDMLLFDAKPPTDMDGALPGGNGLAFDWKLIAGYQWPVSWMLSGGLNLDNVLEAIEISGATIVDISSGLEMSPGNKDINKIKAFLEMLQEN